MEFWENPPANFIRPLLRQVRLEGGPGLRGIREIVVPIPYPFTAICGRNGVGKSTVLALAALSARPPTNWRVYWGNTRPRTRPNARAGYVFGDFFHRLRGGESLDGLRLSWIIMDRGNEVEIAQQYRGGTWRRLIDVGRSQVGVGQPLREVDFLPMSRVLPANEYGTLRSAFREAPTDAGVSLNNSSLRLLSFIMGKAYDEVETRYVRGLGLNSCRAGAAYSGFDMGGGECAVITLLSRLQNAPVGSLILIEELELGLHAEAQLRLVEVLVERCLESRLQIICTTHSEVVLDALPRQARVLLRLMGRDHESINNVSTRFALHEMGAQPQSELVIYTEDRFAAVLVEEAIAGPVRARVTIRDIGSNVALARQAISHIRGGDRLRALSVFDGDCTENQINAWLNAERAERDLEPHWLRLPADGLRPEQWVIRELASQEFLEEFSRELRCTLGSASDHVVAMRLQLDHHDSARTLSMRTGLSEDTARRMVIRAIARRHPGLDDLKRRVTDLLL